MFRVTSKELTGAGSLTEAVAGANATPGFDTIQFDPGLRIDLTSDDPAYERGVVHLTESAIIDGAGSTVFSDPAWVGSGGELNNDSTVDNPNTIIVFPAMRFLHVGSRGQDNSGLEVTVQNLHCERLNNFAIGEDNCSLTVRNVTVTGNRAVTFNRDPFIGGTFGRLTIEDTVLSDSRSFDTVVPVEDSFYAFAGGIQGDGELVMQNVTMRDNYTAGAVLWTGGDVTIVSSLFDNAGGIQVEDGRATIVNSVIDFRDNVDEGPNSIAAGPGARIDLVASTVYTFLHGSSPFNNGQPLGAWGGTINLVDTAVFGGLADLPEGGLDGFAYYATFGGSFTANDSSWVSPVDDQDGEALRQLFNNPNLLTEDPGLPKDYLPYPQSITPLVGTTAAPGLLIDVIPDARPGGANQLLNPVTGQPIVRDLLGNPRWDENGRRNIGAVQLVLAPHLHLVAFADQSASLSWSRSQPPPSGSITGYTVHYRVTGSTGWWEVPVPNPDITGFQVAGLTNGVDYEFEVAAFYGFDDGSTGSGPRSNRVAVTPYGPVRSIAPVAAPDFHEVTLTWERPEAGGRVISGFGVYYRPSGALEWTHLGQTAATSTIVTGLEQGTTYDFGIETVTDPQQANSVLGSTTATTLTNGAPVALDDDYDAYEDVELAVDAPGVQLNDSDPEDHKLTAVLVSGTTHGSLAFDADGSFTYLPDLDFSGTDTFTYLLVDELGAESDTASVTITIRSVLGQIGDLHGFIRGLGDEGVLNKGQSNALLVKLTHSEQKLDRGQQRVAANMIRALHNQIVTFARHGKLAPATAEELLAAIDLVLAGLEAG